MLRDWQTRCIKHATETYNQQTGYLMLACPGAGKTIAAAHIAKSLIDNNKVDYVVCFSPSRIVSQSIQQTFEYVLSRKFNGHLGALGMSRTYHSLSNTTELINNLSNSRVLVIFDEIHHCAGDGDSPSNVWGMQLLVTIQNLATYTLSLTGTPWRTDTLPIPFARYTDPEGNILCDFSYDIVEAIKDKVCRMPQITAIDLQHVVVKKNQKLKAYDNLQNLLAEADVSYQNIIKHPEVIKHLLSQSVEQLDRLRRSSPNTGGLIVASSYLHALQIQSILSGQFNKESTLVSCRLDDSVELIEYFKNNQSEWIISIAMISEGTDIPRLQVCCNLTDVTTELYFRQILGRVLRVTEAQSNFAYMFMLAEPKLVEYAKRLDEAVPGTYTYQKSANLLDSIDDSTSKELSNKISSADNNKTSTGLNFDSLNTYTHQLGSKNPVDELVLSSFKSQIISSYLINNLQERF
ncbi:DEAD/DEAH box helicase family protein [Shewanella sp. AC34-MNA-CIBAN-0136]|uniref:DEAD/DEAH box helicase n=1 Tax=Shewanella sp. AC34-MNA-CIBAN-0136 TaxID=3140463 RepID=UPI00332D5D72